MPGTKLGGQRAAKTNKEKYGDDFYKKIGSKGGRATGKKGFASDPERARWAGTKGGKISRRTGVGTGQGKVKEYYYDGDGVFNKDKKKIEECQAQQIEVSKPPKKNFINKIFGGK